MTTRHQRRRISFGDAVLDTTTSGAALPSVVDDSPCMVSWDAACGLCGEPITAHVLAWLVPDVVEV